MKTDIEKRLKEIMSILPPSIEELESKYTYFIEEVYIQHIPDKVEEAQKEFIKFCVELGALSKDFLEGKIHRQGIVGRYLSDSNTQGLYRVWNRFMSIDEEYREWEQPYYAINYKKYRDNSHCLNGNRDLKEFFRDQKINDVLK